MQIEEQRLEQMVADIQKSFASELEIELSTFRAERVLRLFLDLLGPQIYNEGVQDAQAYLRGKLDDLDAEVFWRSES